MMFKKFTCILLSMTMAVFTLSGCRLSTEIDFKYNSLQELQEAAIDSKFYYFNLDIKEIEIKSIKAFSTRTTLYPFGKKEHDFIGYIIVYSAQLSMNSNIYWEVRCSNASSMDREIEFLGTEKLGEFFVDKICVCFIRKKKERIEVIHPTALLYFLK